MADMQCIHIHPGSTGAATTFHRSTPVSIRGTPHPGLYIVLNSSVHNHNNTVLYFHCTVLHSTAGLYCMHSGWRSVQQCMCVVRPKCAHSRKKPCICSNTCCKHGNGIMVGVGLAVIWCAAPAQQCSPPTADDTEWVKGGRPVCAKHHQPLSTRLG
jgi:hypothetical protein